MDLEKRHLGYQIKRISEALEKSANAQLAADGLTVAQFQLLLYVHLSPEGDITLKEAERFFHVAQSTAAGIAVRLEKTGRIRSYPDPKDRRVKRIKITDAGIEACHRARANMIAEEQKLVSGMTEEEQELFAGLLDKAYDAMVICPAGSGGETKE